MSGGLPSIKVYIRPESLFDLGGTFTLGTGILGTDTLGEPSAAFYEISNIMSVGTRRGRTRITDTFDSGSATVTIADLTGVFNPDNTSSPLSGYVKPMRQIRITAIVDTEEFTLFSGYINSIRYDYINGFDYVQVSIEAFDLMRLLSMLEITTVTGEAYNEKSGTRIEKILDEAGVPSVLTDIRTGLISLDNDPGTQRTVQAAIQQCESAELGAFFVTADGIARFYDRTTIEGMANSTLSVLLAEATFWIDASNDFSGYPMLELDDSPSSVTNFNYTGISQTFDDQNVYNDITVEDSAGNPYTATDATSISEYFRRTYSKTGTLILNGTDAQDQADILLNSWKDPQLIVGDISLDGRQVSDYLMKALLRTDLMHPISVIKTYTSSTVPVERTLTLQGVSHTVTPSRWSITLSAAEPLFSST